MSVLLELEPSQIARLHNYAAEARKLAHDFIDSEEDEPKKRHPLIARKISRDIEEMQTIDNVYSRLVSALESDFPAKIQVKSNIDLIVARWGIGSLSDLPWFFMTHDRFHDFINVIFDNYKERGSMKYTNPQADLLVRICQREPLVILAKTRTTPTPIEEMLRRP